MGGGGGASVGFASLGLVLVVSLDCDWALGWAPGWAPGWALGWAVGTFLGRNWNYAIAINILLVKLLPIYFSHHLSTNVRI